MEGLAVVTSLVVAALIVFIAYLYASRQSPPSLQKSVNWISTTFQRGINVIAGLLGQQPVFKLPLAADQTPVSYTHLTLPTKA